MLSPVARLALLAFLVAGTPVFSQATNKPIPGVDIVFERTPGRTATVIATSDARGQFRSTVRLQPGVYEIRLQCRASTGCGPMRFSLNFAEIKVTYADARTGSGGLQLPAVQKVRIDTAENPALGRLQLSGRVEADPGGTPALTDANAIVQELSTTRLQTNSTTPVNGIGGTGGGRFTFSPGAASVSSSNRDHIDQDAQSSSGGGGNAAGPASN